MKAIALWGGLLFVVVNLILLILTALPDEVIGSGMFVEPLGLALGLAFAGFAGYRAAMAVKGSPGTEKKMQLTMIGGSVALVAVLLGQVESYFLTGAIGGPAGLSLLAAASGGYLAERTMRSIG